MFPLSQTDRRVFETASLLFASRSDCRATRNRLKRYTYGDQWSDMVRDSEGKLRLESDIIAATGRRPVTNNLIRRLVKTIVGRYRDMAAQARWYDVDPDSADVGGELDELDSRLLEEFLISGMAVQRVADDNPLADFEPEVRNVAPDAFFVNDFRDPRGRDIDLVGMLHDMSPAEIRLRFGNGDPQRLAALDNLLAIGDADIMAQVPPDDGFLKAADGRLRIIEIWTREYSKAGSLVWRVRWFAPTGVLIDSYISPWNHRSHPFAVKFYPLTDGEVHSFVEDIVDQQRYINRLVVLIDRIMSTSAKGVLLFPVEQKIKEMSWRDVADRWSAADGVLPVRGVKGIELPRQVSFTGGDSNAHRLLELELRLFDEISGVSSALLGNASADSGVTGAGLYNARVENATIALADIFRTFRSLVNNRNNKLRNLDHK